MRHVKGVAALGLACLFGGGRVAFEGAETIDVLLAICVGATPKGSSSLEARKTQKLEGQLSVPATITIGGLDGTFDVTLGTYVQFTGTAKIVGKKGAKLVVDGAPQLNE